MSEQDPSGSGLPSADHVTLSDLLDQLNLQDARTQIALVEEASPGSDVEISRPSSTFSPTVFFLYDALTDSETLQKVLQLPTPPVLYHARLYQYKMMLWGGHSALVPYPALVRGQLYDYVDGMAYVVETKEQQKLLQEHETEVFSVVDVEIEIFENTVPGKVFLWADVDESELEDGVWSLEVYREEMAFRFPGGPNFEDEDSQMITD